MPRRLGSLVVVWARIPDVSRLCVIYAVCVLLCRVGLSAFSFTATEALVYHMHFHTAVKSTQIPGGNTEHNFSYTMTIGAPRHESSRLECVVGVQPRGHTEMGVHSPHVGSLFVSEGSDQIRRGNTSARATATAPGRR